MGSTKELKLAEEMEGERDRTIMELYRIKL